MEHVYVVKNKTLGQFLTRQKVKDLFAVRDNFKVFKYKKSAIKALEMFIARTGENADDDWALLECSLKLENEFHIKVAPDDRKCFCGQRANEWAFFEQD